MKKLTLIIAITLFSLMSKAQFFPKDTTPVYDFFIVNADSNDFRRCQSLINGSLGRNIEKYTGFWGYKMQDSVTYKFTCEVPDDGRIVKMKELEPIFMFMYLLKQEPSQLAYYKAQMVATSINDDWKWVIGNLQYINRNSLKIVN